MIKKTLRLKIITAKQRLQRLLTALTQVQEHYKSENLLHEIRQIINSLYQAKKNY